MQKHSFCFILLQTRKEQHLHLKIEQIRNDTQFGMLLALKIYDQLFCFEYNKYMIIYGGRNDRCSNSEPW